ncbi:MAG: DUF3306 domain-containing protein [Proteobacteria bacterium]|nr:DUF3306 domain-containing protein [Pseudomonadota bacterium]
MTTRDGDPFLSRWSRRKLESNRTPAPAPDATADSPAPDLPSLESLTPDSDFSGFMHRKVDDKLRRAALKTLFADPAFNVVDGLDDYADDYTKLEALAAGTAELLEHSKTTLFGRAPETPPVVEAADAADVDPAGGTAPTAESTQEAEPDEAADATSASPRDVEAIPSPTEDLTPPDDSGSARVARTTAAQTKA